MSSNHESLIKKKKNKMKAVRAEIEAHPSLEGGVKEALQSVIDMLDH